MKARLFVSQTPTPPLAAPLENVNLDSSQVGSIYRAELSLYLSKGNLNVLSKTKSRAHQINGCWAQPLLYIVKNLALIGVATSIN